MDTPNPTRKYNKQINKEKKDLLNKSAPPQQHVSMVGGRLLHSTKILAKEKYAASKRFFVMVLFFHVQIHPLFQKLICIVALLYLSNAIANSLQPFPLRVSVKQPPLFVAEITTTLAT